MVAEAGRAKRKEQEEQDEQEHQEEEREQQAGRAGRKDEHQQAACIQRRRGKKREKREENKKDLVEGRVAEELFEEALPRDVVHALAQRANRLELCTCARAQRTAHQGRQAGMHGRGQVIQDRKMRTMGVCVCEYVCVRALSQLNRGTT